jgi:hypothetical protein
MATGNSSRDAAQEQRRREELREEYDSGLDNVPSHRQEQRRRDLDIPPDEEQVQAARFGAAGIMGELD